VLPGNIRVAPSASPIAVDVCVVCEQAETVPRASAKHERGIEKAALFFMITPGAGTSARLRKGTISPNVTPTKARVARAIDEIPTRSGIVR
jgi:hypothetical protein